MNVTTQVDGSFNEAEVDGSDLTTNSKVKLNGNIKASSVWTNILYGTGMVAYLALPPMIPGVTAQDLIIFNVGLISSIYFFAFVAQSIRVFKSKGNRR